MILVTVRALEVRKEIKMECAPKKVRIDNPVKVMIICLKKRVEIDERRDQGVQISLGEKVVEVKVIEVKESFQIVKKAGIRDKVGVIVDL